MADRELEKLFVEDPELLKLSKILRKSRPEPKVDIRYRNLLRAKLMETAHRELVGTKVASNNTALARKSWWRLRPNFFTLSTTAGLALIATAVVLLFSQHNASNVQFVTASSPLNLQSSFDPNGAITVAFNQPMNHQSVAKALSINPATAITTSWNDNVLTITPLHHLVSNTDYSVTINAAVARSATGQPPANNISFTFGTAPTPSSTPSATPSTPPTLSPTTIGPIAADGQLAFSPTNNLIITDTGGSQAALNQYDSTGAATRLGGPATDATLSPNGDNLAALFTTTPGQAGLSISKVNGGAIPKILLNQPTNTLSWLDDNTVVYVDGNHVYTSDLNSQTTDLHINGIANSPILALASGGRFIYAAPDSTNPDGRIIDLQTQNQRTLTGARDNNVAFSADGSSVLWINQLNSQDRQLDIASTSNSNPTTLAHLTAGTAVASSIALSANGALAAYGNGPNLTVFAVPSGNSIASSQITAGNISKLTWSPDGNTLALVQQTSSGDKVLTLNTSNLTSASPTTTKSTSSAAVSVAESFVNAQIQHDVKTALKLSGPNLDQSNLFPTHLSRSSMIAYSSKDNGNTVVVQARLISDPTSTNTSSSFVDETLTLNNSNNADGSSNFLVTNAVLSASQAASKGPHIVSATASRAGIGITVVITFDSDINPSSIKNAMSMTDANGNVVKVAPYYNANTRTLTATISNNVAQPLNVTLNTSISDIAGQALASTFTTTLQSN